MFKITYKPSTSHLIFPPIIAGIILLLLFAMAVQRYITCKKTGKAFINMNFHFFSKEADLFKLVGTIVLYSVYVLIMEKIGFLLSSILCIFLFNILFSGVSLLKDIPVAIMHKTFFHNKGFKSVFFSLLISITASFLIWFLFAVVFKVTLP